MPVIVNDEHQSVLLIHDETSWPIPTSCRFAEKLRNLTVESGIYRFKQRFFSARLVQKSHRTGRQRSRPGIVVCVRCDKNDRDARVGGSQLALKIQSTHV